MTKKDFVAAMAAKTGDTQVNAAKALDAFLATVQEEMKNGNRVSFPGFGTWEVVEKPARTCRNPKTGESMKVAAKKVVRFKAGSNLK